MKFPYSISFFLILHSHAMEKPPHAKRSERQPIVVDAEQDGLESQPGVVKIQDVLKACKISKESKIAGVGKNNVKIASLDGMQEDVLMPPATIRIIEFGGFQLCSLGPTKQLAVFVAQSEKDSVQAEEKIGILDTQTGTYKQLLKGSQWIRRIFYDAKTERLIAVYPETIQLWDLKSGSLAETIARNGGGYFKHEVIFSKPKSRIINVCNGRVEWYSAISGVDTIHTNTFDPELEDVFPMSEQEIVVASTAFQDTHEKDPERNPYPIVHEDGHVTYFKSREPAIRFLHFKNSWSDNVMVSNTKNSISEMCYLKKRNQLVSVEGRQVKLYDIKSHAQAVIARSGELGGGFFHVRSCNKNDLLILQRFSDAYILDLKRFILPLEDVN